MNFDNFPSSFWAQMFWSQTGWLARSYPLNHCSSLYNALCNYILNIIRELYCQQMKVLKKQLQITVSGIGISKISYFLKLIFDEGTWCAEMYKVPGSKDGDGGNILISGTSGKGERNFTMNRLQFIYYNGFIVKLLRMSTYSIVFE